MLAPDNRFAFRLTTHTTDIGCGPGAGSAGLVLHSAHLEGSVASVEQSSWDKLEAILR